jgi:uncharacterized lipoprotein YddW (UPF0748 family)
MFMCVRLALVPLTHDLTFRILLMVMLKFAHGAKMLRPVVAAFLGAGLLFIAFQSPAQAPEFRALWVDAWGTGFLNSSQTTQLIADARAYNYNAVIVQMRRRGDAFYAPLPGNDPKTTAVSSTYDALADLISKAHSGSPRIEVHCWVTTQVIWGDGALPSNPAHVVKLHPEYLMKNSSGSTLMAEGLYLDPGHPDAARWNFIMATNIVRNYDIDGFHWDYIRYPQQDSGYNETAIARYNAEFGLSGQPSSSSSQFSTWRRRQVTDFLRWANSEILGIEPNIAISASVFGSRSDAFTHRFQDWSAWNSEGILDLCIPMGYTADNALFSSRVNDAYNNQGVRRIYPGVGAYLNTKENTVWQLGYARSKPFFGTAFYSYRVPNSGTVDRAGTLGYIRDNHQPTWVATPALPWKANPTKGLVKGYVIRSDNGAPVYNANVRIHTSPQRTVLTEAHGHYAFFEATPGTYTISATATGLGSVTNTVTVSAGAVVSKDLVIPAVDLTPPVISDVLVTDITSSSVVVRWQTDDWADSAVDYGPTAAYGSTVSNAAPVTSHLVTISNLVENTTSHFRVRSRNGSGLWSATSDSTFTTKPSSANDVVIESRLSTGALNSNPPYQETGAWADSTGKSGAEGLVGTGARFTGAATATFSWKPSLPIAGAGYDVYLTHHSLGGSISPALTIAIGQAGCTGLPLTTTVFQNGGGSTWEYLGRMQLDPNVSQPVITFSYVSGTLSTTPGQRWYADAAKFVYATPPPDPPEIVSHPDDTAIKRGQNATFVATASGAEPLGYRWTFNGSFIPGGTNSSYTVLGAQPENEGLYKVVVTNSVGSATSSPAMLTVLESPSVAGQPLSQTVAQGEDALFEVFVGGTEPFHYQWRLNSTNIADANESQHIKAAVVNTDQGQYDVVITNAAGAITSAPASLVVTYPDPPDITNVVISGVNVELRMRGGPGRYELDASSDLSIWTNRAIITATNQAFNLLDPASTGSRLFYRLKRNP